jgi:molybdopterin converting factor small subunit
MNVTVEMFGLARRLCGEKDVTFEVKSEASLRDVLVALGDHFPALMVDLIVPDSFDLRSPYIFNFDGRRVAKDLDEHVQEGENLLLMHISVGG